MNQSAIPSDGLLVLTAGDIESILANREQDIVATVRAAYQMHAAGQTVCPHSVFLHVPSDVPSRIIAMPAHMGGSVQAAGMKWISSFPANLAQDLPRASAVICLNSTETGRAFALLEGSLISAKRTAASAALAVKTLDAAAEAITSVGLIGCGLINAEIVRFLAALLPALKEVLVFDSAEQRIPAFEARLGSLACRMRLRCAESAATVLRETALISIATTAGTPHIPSLAECRPGAVILQISLRDIAPAALMGVDNIVDDIEHVCQASTSLHLAAQLRGDCAFIRTTLGQVLNGAEPARRDPSHVAVFSPFGLAILDVALASYVYQAAAGRGLSVPHFHPSARRVSEECHAAPALHR
jgi:2,3-diaminopropionate biosynthesis protein SbnB